MIALLLACVCLTGPAPAAQKPNVLFLLADDQRRDTLSCAGHPIIRTPHLDRLAGRGVLFTNAFVVEPTCKPSRVSIFSGQYERVHQVGFSSKRTLSESQWARTYPALLRRAGYYTGFIGKFGVESYAFRGRAEERFDHWRAHDGWARFWPKPRPNCAAYRNAKAQIITPIMAQCVEQFLRTRDRKKPFCLSVSFSAPHGSISTSMDIPKGNLGRDFWMTRPANELPQLHDHPVYGGLYRDREITLPSTFDDDHALYLPTAVHDPLKGRINTYPYSFERPRCLEHHVRYYQLIHGLDLAVGRILQALEAEGAAEDTVIFYTSDHGLLLGDYGIGGKGLCYDLTAGVPLVVYDPRLPDDKRGRRLEELVLSVDFAPTILSLAGVPVPDGMQGRDLTPLLQGERVPWREEIFLENFYLGRDGPYVEAVRTAQWKYIRYFKPGRDGLPQGPYEGTVDFGPRPPQFEQLFDLREDPGETVNLAGSESHAETLKHFRTRCVALSGELVSFANKRQ